jgi:hypothetical protein
MLYYVYPIFVLTKRLASNNFDGDETRRAHRRGASKVRVTLWLCGLAPFCNFSFVAPRNPENDPLGVELI